MRMISEPRFLSKTYSLGSCLVMNVRLKSSSSKTNLVLSATKNNVTTITMNNPEKYNAWGKSMTDQLKIHFEKAASNPDTKVVVHTGIGPYFCSGGSLAEIVAGARSPRGVQRLIQEENEKIFNVFIQFPKPIIAAVNGPGIGGGVTGPALCDVIIASDRATFLTPFEQLGVKPEGCSTVHFERIMGKKNADKMLKEGYKAKAHEALEMGLISEVVRHEQLLARAQELGEEWAKTGRKRRLRGEASVEEYSRVNIEESRALADVFVSEKFLRTQLEFLKRKGKSWSSTGLIMWIMLKTRPLWIRFL